MGEKAPSTLTVDTNPDNWQGFSEDWSQKALDDARRKQLGTLRARGHTELADYYEQGDQVRADLAADPNGTNGWAEQAAAMTTPETAVETPRSESRLRRFSGKVLSMLGRKPSQSEPNPFDRNKNGW